MMQRRVNGAGNAAGYGDTSNARAGVGGRAGFGYHSTASDSSGSGSQTGSDDDHDHDHGHDDEDRSTRTGSTNDEGDTMQDGFRQIDSCSSFPDIAQGLPFWSSKRHQNCGNPSPPQPGMPKMSPWRLRDKLKTVHAALVLCLNLDVDPPDVVKTNPCAVLECWVDPRTMPAAKALEAIGTNLQQQFESLNPRIKYRPYLDPSIEDTRKFCAALRRQAGKERALFYYNGHGVPRPTPSGELWVFNKNYSQYIPLSLSELQGWLGSPCIYIWECSAAGNLLDNFIKFAERRDEEAQPHNTSPDSYFPYLDSIQLAACKAHETLPMCPELPADLFTSCLTSPMEIALRYFALHNQLPTDVTPEMVMRIPGDIKDRRTPLGELNWIFIAITDTIAWTTFPRHVFRRLFRQDLLVAALFRNFLLAERVMKSYQCTPHTYPPLPPTNTHTLWASWDLAVDAVVKQLPALLAAQKAAMDAVQRGHPHASQSSSSSASSQRSAAAPVAGAGYIPSKFFEQHLTAFQVWLDRGGDALTKVGPHSLPPEAADPPEKNRGNLAQRAAALAAREAEARLPPDHGSLVPRKPPAQLPVLLQVLLSHTHRLRALILLAQFVDLGPWAVNLALTIGIFPYVQKLLQAPSVELKPVLIFIWTRILAVDKSCQADLFNSSGYQYFAENLSRVEDMQNPAEHRAMCTFVLAAVARDSPKGQDACYNASVFLNCVRRLHEQDYLARLWAALCIALLWDGNDAIRDQATQDAVHEHLIDLAIDDRAPEVRAAALFALSTLLGASASPDPAKRGGSGAGALSNLVDEEDILRIELGTVHAVFDACLTDGSPMVRKELLILVSCLVREWRGYFVIAAWVYFENLRRDSDAAAGRPSNDFAGQAIRQWLAGRGDEASQDEGHTMLQQFFTIYVGLQELTLDPYPEVAAHAQTIVDWITAHLLASPFMRLGNSAVLSAGFSSPVLAEVRSRVNSLTSSNGSSGGAPHSPSGSVNSQPARPAAPKRADTSLSTASRMSSAIRRTSSFAAALSNITKYPFSASSSTTNLNEKADGRSSPTPSMSSSITRVSTSATEKEKERPAPPPPHLAVITYESPYDPALLPLEPPRPSLNAPQFGPTEVFEALVLDDTQRLTVRRRMRVSAARQQQQAGAAAQAQGWPSGYGYDAAQSSNCYGLDNGIREEVLPLKSTYFDWETEYFMEPQMRQMEQHEPGSVAFNQFNWRRQRNEKVLSESRLQAEVASNSQWDRAVASLQSKGHIVHLAFHSFDTHLATSNDDDVVNVWDWSKRRLLSTFTTGDTKAINITSLRFINEDAGGLLLLASASGQVRLYRNYDPSYQAGGIELVSTFEGLSDRIVVKRGAGTVTAWNQINGNLLCGGDSRSISVWNADHERRETVIPTNMENPLTAMSINPNPGLAHLFAAGFGDGTIRVYDYRQPDDAVMRTYRDHTHWIQNVCWRGPGLMSASVDGTIKLWDVRKPAALLESWTVHSGGLATFDAHRRANVFAACSALTASHYKTQTVEVFSVPPTPHAHKLSHVNIPGLTHPPSPTTRPFSISSTSMAFHPLEMLYGVGGADGIVRVMGCKIDKHAPRFDDYDFDSRHHGQPLSRSTSFIG